MEPKCILEPRAKQKQTPPGKTHLAHAARHRALGALCLLGLGVALGACTSSSPNYGDDTNSLRGVRTVSFDKNGGDTEAVPASITLRPQETTVDRLPAPPTRAGYTFVEWNTEKDGTGSPFTASTPISADILLIVYARWEALPPPSPAATRLGIRLPSGTATLTPMPGERSATVTVTVDGFHNEADASQVKLSIGLVDVDGLLLKDVVPSHTPNSQSVRFTVEYNFEKAFDKTPVLLSLGLENIPQGYEYVGGPQSLRVDIFDGLEKNRPIPVNAGNIKTFNDYANTDEGLKRHYKLVENVELTPPEEGKSNWVAIGTYGRSFTGSFDGGDNIIAKLTICAPDNTAQSDYQGMFGRTDSGAEIKNLGLEGGSITGEYYVGGLVGRNYYGIVQDSYATGSVTGRGGSVGGLIGENAGSSSRVQNSYATGSVTGGNHVGGLVGINNAGTVQNSYATGSVQGSGDYVGGLIGENFGGRVQNSYATGSVKGSGSLVGGLMGSNGGKVETSYATGSVNGNNGVGGLAGANYSHYAEVAMHNNVALNPSVVATTVTESSVGRVVGYNQAVTSLSGNHARNNMKLELGGAPYVPTLANSQADKKDGAGTAAFNTLSFWTNTLSSWDFSEDGDWEWREGFLPILRGVGGKQEPVVKDVP